MSLLNRLLQHYDVEKTSMQSSSSYSFADRLAHFNAEDLWLSHSEAVTDSGLRRAAVLIAVTDEAEGAKLILTRRAEHLKSHPGQISFPGGMWESSDSGLADTALRESWEEISLPQNEVRLIRRFAVSESRFGVQVTPFLGIVPGGLKLVPCEEETAEILLIPLGFFIDQEPHRIDYRQRQGANLRMPSWQYEGQEIWGLTAMIIDNLMEPLR